MNEVIAKEIQHLKEQIKKFKSSKKMLIFYKN